MSTLKSTYRQPYATGALRTITSVSECYVLKVKMNPIKKYVIRGGSWFGNPENFRSAIRYGYNPVSRGSYVGFRVLCIKSKNESKFN